MILWRCPLKTTSTAVTVTAILSGALLILAVLGAVTAMILMGRDTTELSRFINTTLNAVGTFLAGGAFLYARQAKRSVTGEDQQ